LFPGFFAGIYCGILIFLGDILLISFPRQQLFLVPGHAGAQTCSKTMAIKPVKALLRHFFI
jgi:hypothetical protein